MIDWQPIATAPNDGADILLYYPPKLLFTDAFYSVGRWDSDQYSRKPRPYWHCQATHVGLKRMRQCPPTHWAPLRHPGN
jgi:hypothetical protein